MLKRYEFNFLISSSSKLFPVPSNSKLKETQTQRKSGIGYFSPYEMTDAI
jgi:hypothetical protein